ncbi:guanine nucleotide-binding protein subunit gamma 3-like isoform X2 [Dioscorea cayenensis subsp. rotundata]|uniref:Guanine nucleotide-binding protein subunit gamma 3-like isoform X2 n=1 Tax=Dioscorea cayennensis subsp. rotundata TaxID=55577 RepID=A0AB40D2B1_DIOCR|nr:guanine nucleotide-binding protein subunit gamma 3-like isoform X2 [Dioscorea cayenensis subsp. rotundata]
MAAPVPRSPPDVFGRHRLQAELQFMSREIGLLQEELKSLEEVQLQSASGCCKENERRSKSCGVFKWLSTILCFDFSCICCCGGHSASSESSNCKCNHIKNLIYCCHCGSPCSSNCCCPGFFRCRNCYNSLGIHCPEFSCGCVWSCSKFTEVRACCPGCRRTCCISQCIC